MVTTMTKERMQACLNNTLFEYRPKLTIPNFINFGLEIELEAVDYEEVDFFITKQFGRAWQVKKDESLDPNCNAEIVTPVLQNKKETWLILKRLGELLKRLNPNFDACSFQINYDGKLLPTAEDKVRFLKLFAMYEDIIYRFSKGDDKNYRYSLDMYAAPITLALKDWLKFKSNSIILENFTENKRYGVIFKNTPKDLIEFRTPNGTSNVILWQNYITTFYYLIKLAMSSKYDKREVDKYIDEFSCIYMLENYEKLKEEKAIKLSKMLFNKNIDQVYFLHQYLGLKK